jgi:hypothetical protein
MRFTCNLIGVTLRDRISNDDIREQLKMKLIDEDVRKYKKNGCNI